MFISQAHAASTAGAAESHAFYTDPTFFVALSFVLFFIIFGKKIGGVMTTMLDDRSAKIAEQIDEASRLRTEAQELLASFEKKQHEALKEAEGIINAAKEQAVLLAADAAEHLEASLKRTEQLATDRIKQAEAQALSDVKDMAVDVAVEAAKRILTDDISAKKATSLVDDAINDLDGKLH